MFFWAGTGCVGSLILDIDGSLSYFGTKRQLMSSHPMKIIHHNSYIQLELRLRNNLCNTGDTFTI